MSKILKVRILERTGCFLEPYNGKYYHMPRQQLIHLFFPSGFGYMLVPPNEPADICLCSIQLPDKSFLRKEEVNIMICIENCKHWTHYVHYNKYGDYGDDMIDIYGYNHISSLYKQKDRTFVAIPTLYMRINYYNHVRSYYESLSSLKCSFDKKKFCLITNKSNLNNDIHKLVENLKKYGDVDHISMYDNKILNASCYNSLELLEVFNQYKFVICFENSYNDGYITEKIFNCFLAQSIPIYSGSMIVDKFLNTESFINILPNTIDKFDFSTIEILKDDEDKYNEVIKKNKICSSHNDENYIKEMINVITTKLDQKNKVEEQIKEELIKKELTIEEQIKEELKIEELIKKELTIEEQTKVDE
jgi:hypothetical protein